MCRQTHQYLPDQESRAPWESNLDFHPPIFARVLVSKLYKWTDFNLPQIIGTPKNRKGKAPSWKPVARRSTSHLAWLIELEKLREDFPTLIPTYSRYIRVKKSFVFYLKTKNWWLARHSQKLITRPNGPRVPQADSLRPPSLEPLCSL